MPGTHISRHELHQLSATPNQKVRRDLKMSNRLKQGCPAGSRLLVNSASIADPPYCPGGREMP